MGSNPATPTKKEALKMKYLALFSASFRFYNAVKSLKKSYVLHYYDAFCCIRIHKIPAANLPQTCCSFNVMAKINFYLDLRYADPGSAGYLKLSISRKGKTALIPLNVSVLPGQWDKRSCKVVNHPNKNALNAFIYNRRLVAENVVMRLLSTGEMSGLTATNLKHIIEEEFDPTPVTESPDTSKLFSSRFLRFAESKSSSTRDCYMHTFGRMKAFCPRLEELRFEDITREWLTTFDTWLSSSSPSRNARNIHLRNIRAVFNAAIDDEITSFYPFRRFKIKPVATAKRALSVDELRALFRADVEPFAQKYLDCFKLIFFLIGINVVDLCRLQEIRGGRVEFHRSKTGRLYSIKVEPEAWDIIDRYRGRGQLLDILDRYTNHKDYTHRLNENLQKIGKVERLGRGGKKIYTPMFPGLTSYWARHSWATIAASLDIPKETIAAALGHGGNSVTDIYIDFDREKVDRANRQVLDWVLYGKK